MAARELLIISFCMVLVRLICNRFWLSTSMTVLDLVFGAAIEQAQLGSPFDICPGASAFAFVALVCKASQCF